MGSSRLPGKVLEELGGQSVLGFLLDRLTPLEVDTIVVATSERSEDDVIAEFCARRGVESVRGSEHDVLARFIVAVDAHPADHVIRLTADCPFTDPRVVSRVLGLHLESGADYTTNTLPRTFPQGLDVEVARSDVLRQAAAEAADPAEREHVMPFIYRRPDRFHLANLRSGRDLGAERWTLDTPEDLARLRSMVDALDRHGLIAGTGSVPGWLEVLSVVGQTPIDPGHVRLRPAQMSDAASLLKWRNADDAVGFSSSGRRVDEAEHLRWLASVLDDPGRLLFVGERAGVPVGMVRVDVHSGRGVVSVSVDPGGRRAGVGGALLGQLTEAASGWMQVDHLDAVVHRDNAGSRRLFEGAGFVSMESGREFVEFVWTSPRLRHSEEVARR